MPSSTRPAVPDDPDFDPIADLVARVILALECDGRDAADAMLAAEPDRAAAAQARIQALRDAGMLREQDDAMPERIGPFRVLERLGRGGMGEVYLAEQRAPVSRRVALKVIRRGMDTREVLARFSTERQALALLDHPNIAKIHDAGETADGRPYLVMEYVSGVPITNYCDDRGLDTEARLNLFADVCDTVQHAHERGILHRDLKPSNVLVADRDGKPAPKVIDLGVAKSMQQRLDAVTLHTELGRVLGTPGYMSPEQAANRIDLDTRTDVYSLGVLLYELLTGQLPIETSRLRNVGQGEFERILREEDPPTPSTRVGTLGDASSEVAARRRTQAPALRRRLRGDLDWITMKALERDRNRRYAMATALAQDVRRHLAFEPVSAGPPSASYRVSRFVRRYRATTAAVVAVFLSLVAGLITSVSFWREARLAQSNEAAARTTAEDALDVALRAADELLVEVGGERLRRFPGLATERRRLLEGGLAFCRSVLDRAPVGARHAIAAGMVQARIAWFQAELDLPDDAQRTLDQVEVGAGDGADLLRLRIARENVQASLCTRRGEREQAVAARQRALDAASALLALSPDDVELQDQEGACVGRLASARIALAPDDGATAAAVERAHRATQRAVDRESTPTSRLSLLLRNWATEASWAMERSHPEQAEPVLEQLETQLRRLLDGAPDDPILLEDLAPTLELRARALLVRGRFDEAERASTQAIAIRERLARLYPDDDALLSALCDARIVLASNLVTAFRVSECIDQLRQCIATRELLLERNTSSEAARVDLAFALSKLTAALVEWRRLKPDLPLDEAQNASDRAVDLVRDVADAAGSDPKIAYGLSQVHAARAGLAEALSDLGAACVAYEAAIEHAESVLPRTGNLASMTITLQILQKALGRVQLRQGDAAAARASLERSVALEDELRAMGARYRDTSGRVRETLILLARAAAETGDLRGAEASVARSVAEAPDLQITHREASAALVEIAARDGDPAERRRVLAVALREIETARATLFAEHGQGPDGTSGLMYRLTDHAVLLQKASVLRALGADDQLDATWTEILELARALRAARPDERSGQRLAAAYDALIERAAAGGAADVAARLRAERDSELGRSPDER